jgi:hypothetical protein
MFRSIAALLLAAVLAVTGAAPVEADHNFTHTKCSVMVRELNDHRSPNVSLLYALCIIGRERSQTMAANAEAFHDLDYAIARLQGFGWDWGGDVCGIGEVIGTTTAETGQGRRFVGLWLASPDHKFIASSFYDRAGGSYEETPARTYSAFYVVRSC